MSEDQTIAQKVQFVDQHRSIDDGDYRIKTCLIVQTTGIPENNAKYIAETHYEAEQLFNIQGLRFSLDPSTIYEVFPPEGNLGDHNNVLPHIAFKRSTLPWERKLEEENNELEEENNEDLPWLALLMFHEGEKLGGVVNKQSFINEFEADLGGIIWEELKNKNWIKDIQVEDESGQAWIMQDNDRSTDPFDDSFKGLISQIEALLDLERTPKVIELKDITQDGSFFLNTDFALETGQQWTDKTTIIDVNKGLLDTILPSLEDMKWLSHVRQGIADNYDIVGEELSMIVCNRLPITNGQSTVHLISLENCFDKNGNFNGADILDEELIRLISLKNWSFSCLEPNKSFKGLLKNLNMDEDVTVVRLPPIYDDEQQVIINEEAEEYLKQGMIPIPHQMRHTRQGVSWYRSPLIPGENSLDSSLDNSSKIIIPARCSDELIRYNKENGMFFSAYAAAWEIGRMLALQDKTFSIPLYNWKRASARQSASLNTHDHLPFGDNSSTPNIDPPQKIKEWLYDLSLLKKVPFNYLVPDERMLPIESIRFFQIDPFWILHLLDGAFSIGRSLPADLDRDAMLQTMLDQFPEAQAKIDDIKEKRVSGFLLRSEVVAGWKGLMVNGFASIHNDENEYNNDKLPILRFDRLSDSVLLVLFDGEVQTVDIHQKPETLHFGFDESDDPDEYYKELRNIDGSALSAEDKVSLTWVNDTPDLKVVDINKLSQNIKLFLENLSQNEDVQWGNTSADFALQMIEGVESVRFNKAADARKEKD